MSAPSPAVLRAILLLMGALVLFVLLDATAKHLGRTYPVPMLVWARYAVHFALMVVLLGPSMRGRLVSTGRPGRQVVRALCLLAVTFFSMAALTRMPLAETTAILFAVYVGYFLLRGAIEDPELRRKAAAAVGILGFINVPISYMSVKWWRSLHQTQSIDLTTGKIHLDPAKLQALLFNLLVFTLLYRGFVRFRSLLAALEARKEEA